MHCPFCRHSDSRVVDSRETDEGQAIRRRRSCPECGRRFTTVETAVLAVVKRSGVTEPFSREKVIKGVRRACQGRHVDDDALNLLAQASARIAKTYDSDQRFNDDRQYGEITPEPRLETLAQQAIYSTDRDSLKEMLDDRVGDEASPAGGSRRFPGVVRGPVDLQNLT